MIPSSFNGVNFLKSPKSGSYKLEESPTIDRTNFGIKDLWNIRIAKLRLSSRTVLESRWTQEIPLNGGIYKIPNYTQLEINFIRTMFLESLTTSFAISSKMTEMDQREDVTMASQTMSYK